MAQKTIYSGREFSVYVNNDKVGAYAGTFNNATDATWKRLDVDSVTFPSFSPIQEMEMRTGAGRVAQFDEVFTTSKRVMTEFSLSGRLDTTSLPLLVEAATGTASASDKVTIGTGYAPVGVARGDTIVAGDYHLPLSFYFAGPATATDANSYQLKGCICTSLTLSADMGTASGRFQFDATFQTQDSITKGSVDTSSMSSINSVKLFLADLSTKTIDLAGSATTVELDALWNSISFAIDQPSQFLGTDTNADCEVWARGVPETTFIMSGSVKYDGDTDQIIENYRAANADNAIAIHMSNTAEAGAGSFNVAATGIGFDINKGKLQSAEVSSDDIAMINFEVKALDDGTNDTCAILIA